MTRSVLYMFFEHVEGEFMYSLYAVDLLPSKETLTSHIDKPNQLTPTLLLDRASERFPSWMRCVLWGSKFYFLGGDKVSYKGMSFPSNVFIFDPTTNTDFVTEATPMTAGKPDPVLLFVAYGKMYALSAFTGSFEAFDPNTDTWATLPCPSSTLNEMFSMEHVVIYRKVYILGGEYSGPRDYVVHCFDLDKNEWIPRSKLKRRCLDSRYSIAGFVQDIVYGHYMDKIVGFGPVGSVGDDGEFFNRQFDVVLPVNFLQRRSLVKPRSKLMHLGDKCFCYVITGIPPNNSRSRYIDLTMFEILGESNVKFLHSAHFVADESTWNWENGLAFLQDCILIPIEEVRLRLNVEVSVPAPASTPIETFTDMAQAQSPVRRGKGPLALGLPTRKLTQQIENEKYLTTPVQVKVGKVCSPTANVSQILEKVSESEKIDRLLALLVEEASQSERSGHPFPLTIVFVGTKTRCNEVAEALVAQGLHAVALHGGRSRSKREAALQDFRNGSINILVATDVASRGLDVTGVAHVINLDLPKTMEDYVRRIGRTGRAGLMGQATSFYTDHDMFLVTHIKKVIAYADFGIAVEVARRKEREAAAAQKEARTALANLNIEDKYRFMIAPSSVKTEGAAGSAWDD